MKKHSFITILLTVLMSMVGAKAWANSFEVDGIYYTILQDNTLSVRGINVYDPEVVIPASVEYNGKKYSVTKIGNIGMNYSTETLIISNGVSSIAPQAFLDCHDLRSVTIPNSMTYIGEEAFRMVSLSQIISEIENPFAIDYSAFESYDAKLIVPKGTKAKYQATAGWNQFTNIVEAAGVDGISAYSVGGAVTQTNDLINSRSQLYWSFSNNSNVNVTLLSLQLIDGVTKEEGNLMSVNQLVESGSTVSYTTTIGLLGIHVPVTCRFKYKYDGGESSVDAVYTGSSGIDPISDLKLTIKATGNGKVTYNGTSIRNGNKSFNIRYLDDVSISFTPDNGYRIKYVKVNNSDVTSKISNNQYKISMITSNKTIEVEFESIPNNNIDAVVDGLNYQLNSQAMTATLMPGKKEYSGDIVIPSQVAYNGKIYNVTAIGKEAFYRNYGVISVKIPNSVTSIGKRAFGECYKMPSISIPSSVTEIAPAAFFGCNALKSIDIPSKLKTIEENVFWGCVGLTSVNIPESVTKIASEAFCDCFRLPSISIPNSVKSISERAFSGCANLMKITIGKGVTSIGSQAFANINGDSSTGTRADKDVLEVTCNAETVPETASDAFDNSPIEQGLLRVPDKAVVDYKAVAPWKKFKSVVAIGANPEIPNEADFVVDGIGFNVSTDVNKVVSVDMGMTDVEIPDLVTYEGTVYYISVIGKKAFQNNTSVETVELPNSIKSIETIAFGGCSNLKSIIIPNSVTEIGDGAFYSCSELKSITLPDGIKRIGDNLFWSCVRLADVNIPNNVTSIGEEAFRECFSLSSITIPNSVTEIGKNAFQKCYRLVDVYCLAESVPITDSTVFDGTPLETATLHVPANAIDAYKTSLPWRDFKEIVAIEEGLNGIFRVMQPDTIYSIRGEKLDHLSKGLNIIKKNDGTVKKVFLNR